MQMLTIDEFKKELLDKYEISHGLSNNIIDGMISRGFIPSVTNEVGDETYNIDYYIENEDVFDRRLTEYKNTRGYYTDAELQKALADRDSNFASVPVNAFDNLVRRNLIKKDDYYVVRRNEVFLFSPTLIYDPEQIKSALEELDEQLEAEEAEELGLFGDNEFDAEEPKATEEPSAKSDDEDDIVEEYWDDDYDEQFEKKKRNKKRTQEQKRKEAIKKAEEAAYAERTAVEAKLRSEATKMASTSSEHNENTYTASDASEQKKYYEEPKINREVSKENATEPKIEKSSEYSESYRESEHNYSEKSYSSSENKSESSTYNDFVNAPTYTAPEFAEARPKENFEHSEQYQEPKTEYKSYEKTHPTSISENKPEAVVYKEPGKASIYSSPESSYSSPASEINKYTEPEKTQSKEYIDKLEKAKSEKTDYSSNNSAGADEARKRREEEQRRAQQYEENRISAANNIKQEEKPKLRNEDGTFTFTGTSVGKTDTYESSFSKEEPKHSAFPIEESSHKDTPTENYRSSETKSSSPKETRYQEPVSDNYRSSQKETKSHPKSETTSREPHYENYSTHQAEKQSYSKDKSGYHENSSEEYQTDKKENKTYGSSESKSTEVKSEPIKDKVSEEVKRKEEPVYSSPSPYDIRREENIQKEKYREETASKARPFKVEDTAHKEQTKDVLRNEDGTFSFTGTSVRQSTSSQENTSSEKSSYKEPSSYKINVPLANGSYMTFETLPDENKQPQKSEQSYDKPSSSEYSEAKRTATPSTPSKSIDPYDNYNTRIQAAYATSGTLLSQSGINEIVNTVAKNSQENGFKVTIVDVDENGKTQEKTVYSSKDAKTFIGDITESYRKGNHAEKLPDSTPEQISKDQRVLFAVGINNGGEIKGDTYVPPAVPTIHPRIFDELAEKGIKNIEVDGIRVDTHSLAEASKKSYSIVENDGKYQNATVAQELINQTANSNRNGNLVFNNDSFSAEEIKKAEKTITRSAEAEKDLKRTFALDEIQSNPEFVPGYLREKYVSKQAEPSDSGSDTTVRTMKGFGSTKNLGNASEISGNNEGSRFRSSGPTSYFASNSSTATRVLNSIPIYNGTASKVMGAASEVAEAKPVTVDFSNPKEVEYYASQVENKKPELAKELRAISKDINGDIAIVLASQTTGAKLVVDGARLINNPETYIKGKAEYAEIIAKAIEEKHPDNATKIRELSKNLNGEVADIYRGENKTTGEYMLRSPEKFIKGNANDAETVAKAIESRYPENAKKIRELSQSLNKNTASPFKQFKSSTTPYSVDLAQDLLKNTTVLKGHAKEVEDIASTIEINRPDIAKQLREASKAQNGNAAKIYERASFAQHKLNNTASMFSWNDSNFGNSAGSKAGQQLKQGVFTPGTIQGFQKDKSYKKFSIDNIRTSSTMMTFAEKDRFGRKHLGVAVMNADGTMNITWNANSKKGAVTLKGYAPDIKEYDNTALRGALASKSKLARAGIRNRRLNEVRFNTSQNAQFYLNPEWVKSTRKKQSVQSGTVKDVDQLTNQMMFSANQIYKMYQSGQMDADMNLMHNKHGFAGDGTVVKGLRATEQIKKDKKEILGKAASNIMWHVMPMQELNSTYLGSGYKFLFGRGSFLWTVSNIGAGFNAKDELRKLNRDVLKENGNTNFALMNGRMYNLHSAKGKRAFDNKTASELDLKNNLIRFNLHSAKDRRKLTKELQKLSKSELKIDITRLSDKSLKDAFLKGRLDSRNLSDSDKAMFAAMLQIRGLANGTLSTLTARQYLDNLGIKALNSNITDAHKKLLAKAGFAGRSLDSLDRTEVAQILDYFKVNKINAPADLVSLLERAERLNFANLDTNQGIQALLAEISLAGQNLKVNGVLRPAVNISDLSTKQIKLLLKELPKNDELAKLLNETLKLRGLLEKKSQLAKAIGNLKNVGGFMARKMMFKLRGQAFGDGIYFFYSSYRTAKTSIQIFQTLRALRRTNQAAFRQFLLKGKPGGLRNRLANSKYFKKKFARQDARQARRLKKAQNKSRKELLKKSKRSNRIKKAKGKLTKRAPRGLKRLGNGLKRIGGRASKIVGAVFKPFKAITGFINKVKQKILEKLIIPIIKYGAIAIGAIVLLQIGLGLADAALEGVYSIVNYTADTKQNVQVESVDMSVEDSLTYNSVEIGINLDSAFKYYIEKYYEEETVIDAVKDSIDDTEKNQFFDPAAGFNGKYANIKRLGTTLNGIQTGVYYSYYNGDGKEIGFKSNSKDIAAMANAWIGEDYHAKGLYKSYVEKLWNYSHMVAYAPRKVGDYASASLGEESENQQHYQGTYMYSCPSNLESSECYNNSYDYKCNDGGANVYKGSSHDVRLDIQNGNDKASGKTNYTYTKNTATNKTSYTITNGIVNYNSIGCSQHIMKYHQGSASKEITNKILANGVPTYNGGKWQYITVSSNLNKNVVSLPNGQTATIKFYSNGDNSAVSAPSGCTNWKYINTAYKKTDGTVVACRAYYCAGCHAGCSEKNNVKVSMPTQKIAYHTGTGSTTISGKTYYKSGTISSSCGEKETKYHSNTNMTANGKTYNHVIGTSHTGCNNYGSFVISNSHTTSSKEYCSTSYCQKVTSSQTCTWKLSTYKSLDGRTYATINNPVTQGKWITVRGNKIYAYKASGLRLTVKASAPSGWYVNRNGYINFNDKDFTCSSATVDGVRYVIYPNNYSKTYGTVSLTCYQTPCEGHTVTNTTTTKTTYYYCKGHERCKGYLASDPHDISVNYCKGYCPGHTLEHYCTGHVDLNIAVVTLFLGDKNDLAYLGVPKEVTTEKKEVSSIVDSLTGSESSHMLDVQSPKDGTEYLYDNAFSATAFERFDYEKYPLPKMQIIDDFKIDLEGQAVNDSGNFGNPLDTLRWNSYFVENYVDKSASGTKTLNSVISALFSTYSEHGYWHDLNDGGTPTPSSLNSYDIFAIKGDYEKFYKHHYFDGWFTYDTEGKIEWAGPDGHKTPKDTGAYARAVESTKEDWYEAYKISFPGAYNSRPDNKEIDRILKNVNQYCFGYTAQKLPVAKQLLENIGNTYNGSGIEFAVTWYQNFYKSFKGTENSNVSTAFNEAKRFTTSYTYQAKAFRRSLGVKSMKENGQGPNVIKNLSAGDLIGAGDEVYVVLYNDTKAAGVGIDKGHVIVATVNGSDSSSGNDQIHLFSFTTEYISKKSELFWIYKCG